MHPQATPTRTRRRRWLIPLVTMLVAGMVTTVVVVLLRDGTTPGRPRATETPGAGPDDGDLRAHELELVTEFDVFVYPKDEGRPSNPDELAMEIHGDTGYIATLTGRALHMKAIRLTDGKPVWEQDFPLRSPISSFTMGVSGDVLVARISNGEYIDTIGAYDLKTGEFRWEAVEKLSHVVANRMITYDPDADVINVHDLENGEKVWSAAADGGRASEFPQQTAESLAQPRDPGDVHHATFEVAGNTDENQYVVQAIMHSGALATYDLATGDVISQGTAGDRMTQVVAYEDTVYAYRQTPAELKAYAATDLSKPKWSVQTPASKDGAILDICGDKRLCLKTVSGDGGPIRAVHTDTGETVWDTDEFVSALPPTMAGKRMVLSHQGGTSILDPDTGEATETFDSEVYALPGDGDVVGIDGGELTLSQPDGTTASLGKTTGTGLATGTCEWTRTVALCAAEESYQLWRYRS